jgi:hypothetical protein
MFVKVVGSQLSTRFVPGEHRERTDHGGVHHRQDHPLLPSAGRQAVIHDRQRGSLGAGRGVGQLRQAGPQEVSHVDRLDVVRLVAEVQFHLLALRGHRDWLGPDGIYRLVPIGEDGVFRSAVLDGLWLKVEWLRQEPPPLLLSVLKEWKLIKGEVSIYEDPGTQVRR